MANEVEDALNAIMNAKYGEEVRSSIHDAIKHIYEYTEGPTFDNAVQGTDFLYYSEATTPEKYRDFNNLDTNRIYAFSYNNGILSHTPVDSFTGYVITFSYKFRTGGLQVQFAYHGRPDGLLYFRKYWNGSWSSWSTVASKKYVDDSIAQISSGSDVGKVYYVGFQSESSNYTNIVQCFKDAASYSGHKTIYINNGTYDIYSLMGGDDYVSDFTGDESWSDLQPVLDDVDIIGYGDVTLTMSIPTSIPSNVRWLFSPLNVRGNFSIENIAVEATNCRYCIHDESGSNYPRTVHKYKNVRCKALGSTAQAIGCGYSPYSIIELEDCHLYSGATYVYSFHDKGNARITFKNCVIEGPDGIAKVRLSQEGNYKELAIFDNVMVDEIMVKPEYAYSDSPVCGTTIRLINTHVNKISSRDYTSGIESADSYNTIDGTKKTIAYTKA